MIIISSDNFEILVGEDLENDTLLVTTFSKEEKVEKMLTSALEKYDPSNRQYSTYLNDGKSNSSIDFNQLDNLAIGVQNNLENILAINNIVRTYINKDDIIGKTVDSIETNINTEFRLQYKDFSQKKRETKTLQKVKSVIDYFNDLINIRRLIRVSIPSTYSEGTFIMCLRKKSDGDYVVDYYPLGVAIISDYSIGGDPVVLIDIKELESRLKKTMEKTKKGKYLFFDNIEKEIEANYPPEVYKAFKDKEKYAKLDIKYTGVIRINNLNRKYGLTPIFRALKPTLMLETFEASDRINSKSKAKKIIVQSLRKETMGINYTNDGFDEMAYAHENFMNAWRQSTVVVTTPPCVEDIKYVEPKTELTSIDTINSYRSKVMSTLGISFLVDSGSQTVSTSSISIDQLLKNINKISEQLEDIVMKWYKIILQENGIDPIYAPRIKIIDSEQMDIDIKIQLASLLYGTLNASLETTYKTVGLSLEDEKAKRLQEKADGLDEIFTCRETAYTRSSNKDKDTGRPKGEENDKQSYDSQRQENLK